MFLTGEKTLQARRTHFLLSNDKPLMGLVIRRETRAVDALLGSNFLVASFENCLISQDGLNAALWRSATQGTTRISSLITEFGGEIQFEKNGSLGCASRVGNLDETDRLISAGADVHSENEFALRMAMHYNQTAAAGLLCLRGADMWHAARDSVTMEKIASGGTEYRAMSNFVKEKLRSTIPPPSDHKRDYPDNAV